MIHQELKWTKECNCDRVNCMTVNECLNQIKEFIYNLEKVVKNTPNDADLGQKLRKLI